jgi:AcrR family transcriptional regulator
LTRESVLDAARTLADRDGLAALSMRRLAAELGVEAMSLYNHVANKRDLQAALMDLVWGEVDLALEEADWRVGLHRLCGSAHHALLAHPWFFELSLRDGGPARIAVIEATLTHLERGGIGADTAFHALHVLDGHVYGYSWQAIQFSPTDAAATATPEIIAALAAYPRLAEHARRHFEDKPDGNGFVIGLDLLLDGLASSPKI